MSGSKLFAKKAKNPPFSIGTAPSREAIGLDLIVKIAPKLSLATKVDDITKIISSAARQIVNADGAAVILREGESCYYANEDAIAPLWKGKRFSTQECIGNWCMNNMKTVNIENIFHDNRIAPTHYESSFVKSLAMVPMGRSKATGAIGVYWATSQRASETQIQLLKALADMTSAALERVEIIQSLEQKVKDRTLVLQTLNDELETFSYTVSHDLKNRLTAIKNNCYLLQNKYAEVLDDQGVEYLGEMDKSVQRMRNQLDAILSLFKVTQVPVKLSDVNLSEIAQNVARSLRENEPQRPSVEIVIQPNLYTFGDDGLLRIVMENLLGNAWKYSSKIRRQAHIEFGCLDKKEGDSLIYFVKDNGAGFDSSNAETLFQPFQRMHTEDEFEGTGIGLSSAKRIIHKHGGRIWAESKPNDGATFYFTLPDKTSIAS